MILASVERGWVHATPWVMWRESEEVGRVGAENGHRSESPESVRGDVPPAHETKGARRRQQILSVLDSEPEANLSVGDLALTFGVSVATIRRDLAELQQQRLITRTYGGAALQPRKTDLTMVERESAHAEAKRAIGRAAVELIADGDLVILDSGSTTEQLAVALGDRPVTVITNGLRIVHRLVPWERVRVMVLGGSLHGFNETISGSDAEAMLRRVCATTAFIGTDALDAVRGITARTYEQAQLKTTMIRQAEQVFVVADSSKLGEHPPFHFWSELPPTWGLITDEGADPDTLVTLRMSGASPIIVAPRA